MLCLAVPLLLLTGCLDLPRDPHGTLQRIRDGELRVGVLPVSPWIVKKPDGSFAGAEAQLVQQLAESLRARIRWIEGSGDDLFNALHERELDLVIGGLTQDNPWQDRVVLTRPYLETAIVASSKWRLDSLQGERVDTGAASPHAARIEAMGGIPIKSAVAPDVQVHVKPVWACKKTKKS